MPPSLASSIRATAVLAAMLPLAWTAPEAVAGAASGRGPDVRVERIEGQVTGGFQVTPTRHAATTPPGGVQEFELTVVNQTGRAARFSLSTVDLEAGAGQEYSRFVDAGSSPIGSGGWIELPTDELVLRNLEQAVLPVRVRAPSDAGPGGHYGGVAVALTDEREGGEELEVVTRIVAMVVAMVPGNVSYDVDVADLQVDAGAVAWRTVTARTTVHNTGNIHTTPDILTRFDGEPSGSHEVPGDVPELLPDGERSVTATWDRPPWIGRVRVSSTVELEGGQTVVRRSDPVWVITPHGVGALGGVALTMVVLVVVALRRRRTRRWIELELARMDDEEQGSG